MRNNHVRLISAGLLLLVSLSLMGCEQSNQLTLRLKKGLLYRQKVHLISDLIMPPFPGADYHDSELILRYQVNEVNDQGVATLRITIESIKASMKSLTISAAFDSSKPLAETGAERTRNINQRFYKCFDGLQGTGFSAELDLQGRVIRLFDLDQRLERVSTGPIIDETVGGHQVAHLLSPSHLRQYVALGMHAAWAQAQPAPDQTWINIEPVETPRATPVMARKTFKIDEIKKENGARIAVVSFETTGAPDQPLPDYTKLTGARSSGEVSIKTITGTGGKITFSLSRQRLLKLEENIMAEIVFPGTQISRTPATQNQTPRPERKIYYKVDKTIEYIDK